MIIELTPEFQTFLMSILPIAGVRASIPYGISVMSLSWQMSFFISIVGGAFATLMIFSFLDPVTEFMIKHFKIMRKIINYVFEKTKRDKKKHVDKHGYIALAGFTAVPLPFSGVWTASLVTYLFGLNYKKAFLSIMIGALVSAALVTTITKTGESLDGVGGLRLVGLFFLIVIFYYYTFLNKKNNE